MEIYIITSNLTGGVFGAFLNYSDAVTLCDKLISQGVEATIYSAPILT